MRIFGSIITAMVTPFNEQGELCKKRTETLVEHLIDNGSDSLVLAGTTGEAPTLSKDEKISLFSHVAELGKNRIKTIANVGTNSTKESIEFLKNVEQSANVDGFMLVVPYYNKPNQEGLYLHFKSISESTDKPIMLYNIPSRTGINLNAETTIRLSEIKNIVAIKESSGNLSQMATIIENTPNDFHLYSGDDNLTLPILSIGGSGVVSVASHVVGPQMNKMINRFYEDIQTGAKLHRELLFIFEEIFFTTNPVPVKALLNKMGIEVGDVRLPLSPIATLDKQKLDNLHDAIKNLSF
jgi:4-hydroxy-tetrahydrodipicolinate synthase